MRSRLTLALLLSLPAATLAGPPVLFEDGRALRVASISREEGRATIELEGGGRMAIDAARVVNWDEIERWKPSPRRDRPTEPSRTATAARWRLEAGPFAPLIDDASRRHGVDPALLTAMAQVESALDPSAVSPKGAQGLLQLMPATAVRFGVRDPFDPVENLNGGAAYLRWLLERFEGREDLALAGYNAGEGAVDRHRGIPPYRETRRYVRLVLDGVARLAP